METKKTVDPKPQVNKKENWDTTAQQDMKNKKSQVEY